MKQFTLILLLACLGVLGCSESAPDHLAVHRQALVADMHSDTVLKMRRGFDLGVRHTEEGHMDIPRLQDGGVDLQVFACWLDTETPADSCRPAIDRMIDTLQAQIARYDDRIGICRTAAEAKEIIGAGRLAAFIGIENGVALAGDLDNLSHYYNRGVRYLTLTHTASSDWCISSADTMPEFDGLTQFGEDVVREMNDLGMVVDISHAHPRAVDKVLAISSDPVIASHSCVYALCKHNRNLTDDQIRAIAAGGGVIGINFYNGYLSDEWNRVADSLWDLATPLADSIKALYADSDSLRRGEMRNLYRQISARVDSLTTVDVKTVCDHIDYIANLVGVDHVGLGSDYDGVPAMPAGLEDCAQMPNITGELMARGYTSKEIEKVLGGNFMRVFARVCGATAS